VVVASTLPTVIMSWELTRRRLARAANSKFIYDRVPLLHAIIFFVEMVIVARLVSRFNAYYDERPVLTMMVTNAVLGGIADTVAQTITSVRQRALRKPGGIGKDDSVAVEIHELDRKNPWSERDLIPDSKLLPPPFDFERLTRFMAYGFAMAPVQFKWFGFLSRAFPITKTSAFGPALKRVAMDQLVFAPFGIACFFSVMTIAEGGGRRAVVHKLRDMYLPTLKANFVIWPAVQVINFRLMPVAFQLPFVSTIGIAWTAYLSLSNASDDAETHKSSPHDSPNVRIA
jgi:protein Mpv17